MFKVELNFEKIIEKLTKNFLTANVSTLTLGPIDTIFFSDSHFQKVNTK